MRKLMAVWVIFGLLFAGKEVKGGDDVYDELTPKKIRVSKHQSPQSYEEPAGQSQDYYEENSTSPSIVDYNNQGSYLEDNGSSYASSYTNRIEYFHNPSVGIGVSMGYGGVGAYGNYYDPYYGSNSWYNTGWSTSFWFTPSWYWGYYNYWNPFYSPMIVVSSPWMYNYGWYYDPWYFGWNSMWYSSWYNPWYNPYHGYWPPYCNDIVVNNGNHITYTPRVNTSTNSPGYHPRQNSTNTPAPYTYPKGTNSNYQMNKQQKKIQPMDYDGTNGTNYKPKPAPQQAPSNSSPGNWGTRNSDSGIKINKQPK